MDSLYSLTPYHHPHKAMIAPTVRPPRGCCWGVETGPIRAEIPTCARLRVPSKSDSKGNAMSKAGKQSPQQAAEHRNNNCPVAQERQEPEWGPWYHRHEDRGIEVPCRAALAVSLQH